ncbi:MAG: lipoate--protein ligase family protein [Planctomycetes bacterium]|nr:lipoate--protein ligase family protein [Planctomycetota bacterium]
MTSPWRLIIDEPSPGDWNMAVDQVLLEQVARGDRPALRFYAWDQPTLSLGYFQTLDEIPEDQRDRCPIVRRATGGGAILHDRELTYSLAAPANLLDGPMLYELANRAIVAAVAILGGETEVRGEQRGERAQRGPFFCFARAGSTDIIARSMKLAGSAQRRADGGVLQHGSIMLDSDQDGTIGLAQLVDRPVTFDELAAPLAERFAVTLEVAFERSELSDDEQRRAEQIRCERFADPEWLLRGKRKGTA